MFRKTLHSYFYNERNTQTRLPPAIIVTSLIFRPSLFTMHYVFGLLFTIHYKKVHYLLIIIPIQTLLY